ncbi:dead box ATP-dependent RNA helicase [Striga asiatica]|uniref:DEAD-box ATP-dependent RNA helicase 7 n=1 Tax=Striga asiatica TaxID=4170 RepID=A0A5A7Q889_STRAF|nr:dead box ATP-dependent RNA helicase [Striga asiatica]
MPSIVLAESQLSDENKRVKKAAEFAEMEVDAKSAEKKIKKEKKSAKKTKIASEPDPDDSNSNSVPKKGKEKKRKALEIGRGEDDGGEEKSDISSNSKMDEPMNDSGKKKKKMKLEENGVEEKEENPNAVSNFRISKPLRDALKAKGIESLFPIQAMTFDMILDGSDLVGRARTGQGKTLAFVLPILESLTNGPAKASRKTGYGRAPSVLVLLPTRELATQVFADFEVYGGALGLNSCCLYGGAPFNPQRDQLKRGVDLIIGTPGRIKDHIERGNIDFRELKFRVLDEADEMLRMGKVEDASKVQTLLFSATLPPWVKQISAKFLKPDKKTADLVGNEKMKASTSVRHLVLPCSATARSQLIPDIIRCYSSGGRTIIFTETKDSASTLAGLLPGARALHGDIQQATREVTLAGFRSGKFSTLVATNVAARGLDIDDVQLIIQVCVDLQADIWDFLTSHFVNRLVMLRRTSIGLGELGEPIDFSVLLSGKSGVAVMLYDPRKSNFSRIERESGVKFEHISAPQPADIAKTAGAEAADKINEISDRYYSDFCGVIPVFMTAAEELLNSSDLTPTELLAKALAKAAGYTEIKTRSLLTSMENCVTVQLECGRPIFNQSFVYGILRRFLPEDKVESIKGLSLTADGKGAVFDVAANDLDAFLEGQQNAAGVSLEVMKTLPPLQEREQSRGRFGGGNGGRGRGGGSSDRRFSGGRGGIFSRGRGRGNSNNNRRW